MRKFVQQAEGPSRQRVFSIYSDDWKFFRCDRKSRRFFGRKCGRLKTQNAQFFNAITPSVECGSPIGIFPFEL